ncbi:MAG: HEAT repeat domain-containing protein [Deltaproteobacteria bacterium]|jgi:hypothetical protein|nr:HEAT repeat domain-containing protein [Deltaproteobacteria bacterium]
MKQYKTFLIIISATVVIIVLLMEIFNILGLNSSGFKASMPSFPETNDLISGDPYALPTSKNSKKKDNSQKEIDKLTKKLEQIDKDKVVSPFKINNPEIEKELAKTDTAQAPEETQPPLENLSLEEQISALGNSASSAEVAQTQDIYELNYREILASDLVSEEQVAKFLYKDGYKRKLIEGANYESLINELIQLTNSMDQWTAISAGIVLGKFLEVGEAENVALILQQGSLSQLSKILVVEALGKLGDPRSFKILYDEYKRSTDSELRDKIIEALANLKDTRVVNVLYNIITSRDRKLNTQYTKYYAIAGMAKLKITQARKTLESDFDMFIGKGYAKHFQIAREYISDIINPDLVDTNFEPGVKLQELFYKGTRYFLYIPTRSKTDYRKSRVLTCIPGLDYAYEELHELCSGLAKKYQMAALTVVFDLENFPSYWSFNLSGKRSDQRLLDILKHVSKHANLDIREIYLFGDYEGGEFVQAFVLHYPQMIGRAMFIANKLIKPNPQLIFPQGIGKTPYDPSREINIIDFLKSDIAFLKTKNFRDKKALAVLEEYRKIYEDLGITPRFLVKEYQHNMNSKDFYGDKIQTAMEQYLFQGH